MSSGSATASAALTIAASGNLAGKQTVINELEKVLMKGRYTPEGKLNERTEKEKKQIINENLLAARQRWLTQNRIKTESATSAAASSSAGGSDESDDDEPVIQQRGLTYSCEPALNTRIDKMDTIEVRANRAYSNTAFSSNRIIPNPPKNPPPPLTIPVGTPPATSGTVSPKVRTQPAQKTPKDAKKESTSSSATTSKMKKIFNFKPKKKKKRKTKKMTPTRTGSMKREVGNSRNRGLLTEQKSMSDSSIAKLNVLVSTSSIEEDLSSAPIHVPSLGYQNVFDNPEFAKYTQKSPNRSNTSSPMELVQTAKPPKPLPRAGVSGGSLSRANMISTGSERETDQETPPPFHTNIPVVSPLMSSSPNSDCLTPVFQLPLDNDSNLITPVHIPPVEIHLEDSTDTISRPRINTKERLVKTVSCSPDGSGWDIKRRGSSQKQKELRRGVCSEGPGDEDEYITIPSMQLGVVQESLPCPPIQDLLSIQNQGNSRDSYRLSAAYLKLLPLEIDGDSNKSSNSGSNKRRPPPPRPLQKVKTVPAFSNHHQLRSRKTSPMLEVAHDSDEDFNDRQATRSASPQRSAHDIQFEPNCNESAITSQRNLQYISVSVETTQKKRKPSVPKKFKYQIVAIDENGDPRMMPNAELSQVIKPEAKECKVDEARPESSQERKSFEDMQLATENKTDNKETMGHRYYVNRNSMQINQTSDNLPTTMLRTVDPLTGKIIWHEYVEIDEEEIDKIASQMGMSPASMTSTAEEKLEVLLSNDDCNECTNEVEAEPNKTNDDIAKDKLESSGSVTSEGVIDDSHLSGTSTVSSECKYVLNIDEPPSVPPRPEILSSLFDDEEYRSSGDYSYAFIPGVGARWVMPGGHTSPKMMIAPPKETCPVSESSLTFKSVIPQSSPVQSRASSNIKDQNQVIRVSRPPSLPPKTDSLMREQQCLTKSGKIFPFPPDIIVKTKKSKKKFSQAKRAPPKVIPYSDHQKQKLIPGNLASLPMSSLTEVTSPSVNMNESLETKKHSGQKSHKKLARQRSHGRRSYRKANTKSKDATKNNQRVAEPKSPKMEIVASELMESLAISAPSTPETSQKSQHTESTNTQGLSKILNDLGQLLKNSNYSESDILSAIESHLKQGAAGKELNVNLSPSMAMENCEEDNEKNSDNEYEEPESWLSGEEPESEIELEASIPIGGSPLSSIVRKQLEDEDSEEEEMKSIHESKRLFQNNEDHDELEYEEMSSLPIFDHRRIRKDSKTHSYVNLEYGTEPIIYEHDESKRYSYVDMDIESNLDLISRTSPAMPPCDDLNKENKRSEFQSSNEMCCNSTSNDLPSTSLVSLRERSKSSTPKKSQSTINPRSSRTQSNPDSELADAVVAGVTPGATSIQPMPRKNKSLPELRKHRVLHEETSLQMPDIAKSERTTSYRLALQMEDILLSQSAEVNTSRRRLSAVREEGSNCKDTDFADSDDFCCKSLQRSNAVITKRKIKGAVNSNTGSGVFSHRGGKLTKIGSDITIEVPEGAVPRGQTQKIWFKVVQRVFDPSADDDTLCLSLSDSISTSQVESHLMEKRGKQVQLSPMIVVGPHDAVLEKPLIVRMPHCLPYRNNSWHLQMLGRPSIEGGSEDWQDIMNTIGLIQISPTKSKSKFQNRSSYQMHLDYVQVKTSQLGSFKLVGRPIRNGTYAAKKMVSSVYAKPIPESKCVQIDIFVNNAIEDQSQALDNALTRNAHIPLMRDMPILCFGDGKDMEVTLSNDSNTAIPLGTKSVAFGQFWRSNKVGSSHIMFKVEDELVEDDRALTLKVQQAESKLYHETNFLLPDLI